MVDKTKEMNERLLVEVRRRLQAARSQLNSAPPSEADAGTPVDSPLGGRPRVLQNRTAEGEQCCSHAVMPFVHCYLWFVLPAYLQKVHRCWHHACANHVSYADCFLVVTSGTPGYWRTLEEVEAEASDPVGRNAPSPWVSPFALPWRNILVLRCCLDLLPLTSCLPVFICPCLTRWRHNSEAVCKTRKTFCLCDSLLYTAIHVRHVIAT